MGIVSPQKKHTPRIAVKYVIRKSTSSRKEQPKVQDYYQSFKFSSVIVSLLWTFLFMKLSNDIFHHLETDCDINGIHAPL